MTDNALKHGVFLGLGMGDLFFSMLASYSLGFWFGSHCLEGSHHCPASLHGGNTLESREVITTYFALFIAVQKFIEMAPALKKINEGRQAAAEVYAIIDK